MKSTLFATALAAVTISSTAQGAEKFTNFIRQVQVNSAAEQDVDVQHIGEQLSPLAIDPGGARFELWTVRESDFKSYLLDQVYVSTYTPQAILKIESMDPYETIPRTRADQPFTVTLSLDAISSDPSASDAARMVKFQHHLQAYEEGGDATGIDRAQASLIEERFIDTNGDYPFPFDPPTLTGVVASSKARGEERFTVYSLPDYQAPELVLASKYVQVWPVADGLISGIAEGDSLRFNVPQLTITLNDLYPDSSTYVQVYKGMPAPGVEGMKIVGSTVVIKDAVPQDKILVLDNWDSVIEESGTWTMEILTETPFGIDRLDTVSFSINRDINMNATVTTVE